MSPSVMIKERINLNCYPRPKLSVLGSVQEDIADLIGDLLTHFGGDLSLSDLRYAIRSDNWDALESPTALLQTMPHDKLVDFTERACQLLIERCYPAVGHMKSNIEEVEGKLLGCQSELITVQRDVIKLIGEKEVCDVTNEPAVVATTPRGPPRVSSSPKQQTPKPTKSQASKKKRTRTEDEDTEDLPTISLPDSTATYFSDRAIKFEQFDPAELNLSPDLAPDLTSDLADTPNNDSEPKVRRKRRSPEDIIDEYNSVLEQTKRTGLGTTKLLGKHYVQFCRIRPIAELLLVDPATAQRLFLHCLSIQLLSKECARALRYPDNRQGLRKLAEEGAALPLVRGQPE
eukprot:sb/3466344/